MAISGCINGLMVSAFVLLLVPLQYYIPRFEPESKEVKLEPSPLSTSSPAEVAHSWFTYLPHDILLSVSFFLLAMITYLCDWIQRKLMERRILKLKRYLWECVDRLRLWDARQEQLEVTLRMVENATTEYNLLLYLLLRVSRPPSRKFPSCYFDKELDDLNITTAPIDICEENFYHHLI